MPLKCLKSKEHIYSFNLGEDEWDLLRLENKKTDCLATECCGSKVVLKTSKLGTRFFAHARKGICKTAPESAEHILAKIEIVEGIRRTSWVATAEHKDSEGGNWQADVLATKNKSRIAFEVQWSRQTLAETNKRHIRYKASGVRDVWLFKQYDFRSDKDLPAFQIRYDEQQNSFDVYIPSPLNRFSLHKDKYSLFPPIPIRDFVEGCLTGKLKFAPAIGSIIPLNVLMAERLCKRCKRNTNIVTELTFCISEVFQGCFDLNASIHTRGIEKWLPEWLPDKLLKSKRVGKLKFRKSFMEVENHATYFSNGCFHCDGIQPRYYENGLYHEEQQLAKVDILFTEEMAAMFSEVFTAYWWFDTSHLISNHQQSDI